MTREPVALSAAIVATVNAFLILLVSFGVELTPDQTAAIMGFTNMLLALVAAVWTRARVTPTG